MYSLAIHFYAFIIALISPFHKKARIMRLGQWKTNSILREKIDRNAKIYLVSCFFPGRVRTGTSDDGEDQGGTSGV